jgi:outer membrane immunogenic protein
MNKRSVLISTVLAAGLTWGLPANAGSMDFAPAPHWSGFYLGVNVGAGSFDAEITDLSDGIFDEEGSGVGLRSFDAVYGAQIGVNWQRGSAVFGLEADFNGTGYDRRLTFDDGDHIAEASWNWFSTVRARLGLAVDNVMIYVTGGLAIVRVDYCGADNACVTDSGDNIAFSKTELGFVAGVGTELLIDPNWSLKAEYLYIDAGEEIRGNDGDTEQGQFESNAHIFRVGLNYHIRDSLVPLEPSLK